MARTRRFTLGVPRGYTVSPDGERVFFLRTGGGEDPVSRLWLWEDGRERVLADPAALDARSGPVPEEERIRRERARERASGVVAYATDSAGRMAAFALDAGLWTAGTDGGVPRPVPTPGPVVDPRPDAAGHRVAYVSGGALRVVDVADGADRALVAPEAAEVSYGLAEHVAAESMHRRRGYWWAPDGERLLVARVDNSPVQRWWISDPANPHVPPREIRYPAAGTANADVSLHVVGLDGGRREILWDRAAFEYLVAVAWDAHGPLLVVQSRDQRTTRVLAADPDTGATELLHEEHDPSWVEIIAGTPLRTASGALVRTSDADGSRRLVISGRAVTPPGLQVFQVLGSQGESVLFTASDEPTEEHLWSYGPEQGLVRISEDSGVHSGAAGGGTLVHHAFTERGHGTRVLHDGKLVGVIASVQAEPLVAPRVTWLSAGKREVRTALLLPSWYEAGSGPLPVLMAPYSGPATQLVVRARHAGLCEAQWFAECGFAVVIADGRGTPGRGPAWEKSVRGDKYGPVLEDQVAALHAAAAHCPDLDLTRVGFRGWSYGGSLAALAVMRRPDVFHAAVAGAPAADPWLYDMHWTERFHGHPDVEPETYRRSSVVAEAASPARPLLLIHGLADDNVVVAHTLRLSAALLAAGHPHSVLPLPSATHMPTDETVVSALLTHQLGFLRDALGVSERPEENSGKS
ncbi:prolyl oligopeptidase family serine peptidase [Actinacidiphila soli]|uniref:prolyl oligopeptidase family serine peptidase n=1 Tax=Actinacidiphila soli TaxID=2487275 RepID=UPI000FCC8054|nr:prolyl oligopeptidase family serine peptidase [Actinacidiphila soli]